MECKAYLDNPCKASSLPFWKTNAMEIPKGIRILLDEDLQSVDTDEYTDEKYFKLIHRLNGVERPLLDSDFRMVSADVLEYVKHIEECYDDIGISFEELTRYKFHEVYDSSLWVAVKSCDDNRIVASGIAELDTFIKEGILEWIQVSKDYRGKGLGKFIVKELLWRMKGKADFVTVSGKVDNSSNPKVLYESCGFADGEIWHILTRR